MHEYVATEPLPTEVCHRPIKKSVSNGDDIVMDANPAYVEGSLSANEVTVYIRSWR